MRKLNGKDVFKLLRIFDAADIKEELKKSLEEDKTKTNQQLGAELILTVISGCSRRNCENLIFEFLASVLEEEQEAVEQKELGELLKDIIKLVELNGLSNLKDFFVSAYRLSMKN